MASRCKQTSIYKKNNVSKFHFENHMAQQRTSPRASILARIPQVPPKKKYQVINERLKYIVSEFDTYENMIAYCRAIAHNL